MLLIFWKEKKAFTFLLYFTNIGRNAYIDKLKEGASSAKKNLFSFSWTEGGVQKELEQAVQVSPADYPTIVAINRGKGKYSQVFMRFL